MQRVLIGKTIVEQDAEALMRIRSGFDRVVIDVGTGDGRFVLRAAREDPGTLFIGIDPVADNMIPTARKARKKPAKGGAENALFVVSSLEQLGDVFDGWAAEVHVGYPWGSLLAAFVEPNETWLTKIAGLTVPGGGLHIRLNYSVFEDEPYMERLGLPQFDSERLLAGLKNVGVEVEEAKILDGSVEERSSWERRLIAGSNRKTFVISAHSAKATT